MKLNWKVLLFQKNTFFPMVSVFVLLHSHNTFHIVFITGCGAVFVACKRPLEVVSWFARNLLNAKTVKENFAALIKTYIVAKT